MFYGDLVAVLYKVLCFGSVESEINFWLKLFQILVKKNLGDLWCARHCQDHSCLYKFYLFQVLKELATNCLLCKY